MSESERKPRLILGEYYGLENLRNAHSGHWFSPGAMRFFNSRLGSEVYPVPSGWIFVSSERFDQNCDRMYTIRKMDQFGDVDTVGEFQAFSSSAAARRAMRKLYDTGLPEINRLREISRQEQEEQNARYMATMQQRLSAQKREE